MNKITIITCVQCYMQIINVQYIIKWYFFIETILESLSFDILIIKFNDKTIIKIKWEIKNLSL